MKNKQHEYILRAFLEAKIPEAISQNQYSLISLDSTLGGYCSSVLKGNYISSIWPVITKEDKQVFAELINLNEGNKKTELIIYYRLAALVEEIIMLYKK